MDRLTRHFPRLPFAANPPARPAPPLHGSPLRATATTEDPPPAWTAAPLRPDIWRDVVETVSAQLFSRHTLQHCIDTSQLRHLARAYAQLARLNKASLQKARPFLATLREAHCAAVAFSALLRQLDEGISLFRAWRHDWRTAKVRAFVNGHGLHLALRATYPREAPRESIAAVARMRMECYLAHLVRRLSRLYKDPSVGVKAAEQIVIDVLQAFQNDWPDTTPTTLLDNNKLVLCFGAVVFRDWLYEPFTYGEFEPKHGLAPSGLMRELKQMPGFLPPRELALLAIDQAILRLYASGLKTDDALAFTHELRLLVDRHPQLETQLLELEEMLGFLTGEAITGAMLNRLIDHLLREDAHWGAADITLLLHLAVLTGIDTSTLAHEHTAIGSLDTASVLHVEAMDHLARFQRDHALRGTALLPAQVHRIEGALVDFMKHLCLLVPEHQAAGAWKHLELIPQPLLVSAFLRLDISERVKIAASCPEWPDLNAVFRDLPIPEEDQRTLARHFASTWPHLLSLTLFSQLGRWRDWMDSFGPTGTRRPH